MSKETSFSLQKQLAPEFSVLHADRNHDQVRIIGQRLGSGGSYTTIVEREDATIITPDIAGQFPMYWSSHNAAPVFSTKASTLGNELNTRYLAAIIGCHVDPLLTGETIFENVHKIEGGQQALFAGNRQPKFESTEIIPDYELAFDDAAAMLREALIEAIELRLALGKVTTSDCSGGFDSTSIALLTADRVDKLDAFIQYNPLVPAGDIHYAREYVKDTNVRLHELSGNKNTLPFQGLDDVDLHDEPDPATTINRRIKTRLLGARACGSEVHFTGDGGDAVLDTPPNYLIDLVRSGRKAEMEEAAYRIARMRYMAPQDIMEYAERNAAQTLSDDLHVLAKKLLQPTTVTPSNLTWISWPGRSLQLLTSATKRQLSEYAEQKAEEVEIPDGIGAADYIARNGLRSGATVHRHLREIAATMGTETVAPFMDSRVVEACLRLPAYMRADPRYFKNILRTAFRGILPETLLNRTSKGEYLGEQYKGLRAARPEIESLLKNSRLAELGVIEPTAVRQEIERADMGLVAEFPALDTIVAAEVWLRKREQANE